MADEKGKEKIRSIDNAAITLIDKAQKENVSTVFFIPSW